MDHQNHNTESRKNKHLNAKERLTIELRLKDGYSAYKIAKELNRSINTILNEIKNIDTRAFISVSSAMSVFGEGFEEVKAGVKTKKIPEKVEEAK